MPVYTTEGGWLHHPREPLDDVNSMPYERVALVHGCGSIRGEFDEPGDEEVERRHAGYYRALAEQADRLLASDVVWDDLFKDPATAELKRQIDELYFRN